MIIPVTQLACRAPTNVTIATSIWEKTYPYMLGPKGMFARNITALGQRFDHYLVAVNNGVPPDVLRQDLIPDGAEYINSEPLARQAASLYDIKGINKGFWYSAGPLAAIVKCPTEWLLYIADDVELVRSSPGWIDRAIFQVCNVHPGIMATSPMWHKPEMALLSEHPDNHLNFPWDFPGDADWMYTRGFSDHCFLIRVSDFRKMIYNEKNPASDRRYPAPGAFEKRIGAYMANHGLWRQVCLSAQWQHESYAATGNPRPAPTI